MSSEHTAGSGSTRRLVVASNRLPVVLKRTDDGWKLAPGLGGLVTALGPVLQGRGGIWIGWPGSSDPEAMQVLEASDEVGYTLLPIELTAEELQGYYYGFSNEVLWPLFHDLVTRCNFDPSYWPLYQQVNRKFATRIAQATGAEDYVWIQDYHLMLCGAMLREMGVARRVGFFLHIPFPPLDLFLKLPWRFEVLQGLLQFDLVGFQTPRDRRNFLQCVRTLIPGARVAGGQRSVATLTAGDRELRVGAFPIGIDSNAFSEDSAAADVTNEVRFIRERTGNRHLILGVDRLDYTKGIPERILAVGAALERYPDLVGKITFNQIVVPSRESVPEYQQLRDEVERLVGYVNGRFTTPGWTPIHYHYRALSRTELLAFFRASQCALITPLKDGMNLVAKEYCACSQEEEGVLLLSEFAGAASQMHRQALLVNPHDIAGIAAAIHRAFTMPRDERRWRMRAMRRLVQRYNVFWWVDQFLRAGIARELSQF
jgi:trehalose 6-phosphate synthase